MSSIVPFLLTLTGQKKKTFWFFTFCRIILFNIFT